MREWEGYVANLQMFGPLEKMRLHIGGADGGGWFAAGLSVTKRQRRLCERSGHPRSRNVWGEWDATVEQGKWQKHHAIGCGRCGAHLAHFTTEYPQ